MFGPKQFKDWCPTEKLFLDMNERVVDLWVQFKDPKELSAWSGDGRGVIYITPKKCYYFFFLRKKRECSTTYLPRRTRTESIRLTMQKGNEIVLCRHGRGPLDWLRKKSPTGPWEYA